MANSADTLDQEHARHLEIYVGQHCMNCAEALRIAALAALIPDLTVRVIEWDDPRQAIPARIVAVPTYVLDGRIVALGNPAPEPFLADLRRHLSAFRARQQEPST